MPSVTGGYAPEYVEGMWKMLQLESPEDFILATGETHTVRELAELAFKELGMELEWEGEGAEEKGILKKSVERGAWSEKRLDEGTVLVEVDPRYYRPTEVDMLIGDASKAKEKLGWEARVKFEELVRMMAEADWEKVQKRGF